MATKTVDQDISAAAAAMGRKGGPARAKSLTAEQRSEIARGAARKRWDAAKESRTAKTAGSTGRKTTRAKGRSK